MQNHQQPGVLTGQLGEVIELSRITLERVNAAFCDQARPAGSCLPDVAASLCTLRHAVEDQALAIDATRVQPSVADLRTVMVAAQVNADAECVGQLAQRLADIAGSRPARPAAPAEVQAIVCRMGRVCVEMIAIAGAIRGSAWVDTEAAMCAADAEVQRLRRRLYRRLLQHPCAVGVDAALDASLACSYYVRCAELAVSMARHAALATSDDPVRIQAIGALRADPPVRSGRGFGATPHR